jgi:CheY-like chemotaxis protein
LGLSRPVYQPRAFAGEPLDDLHAAGHVLALHLFRQVLVVDPAPAVAGDLVAQLDEGLGQLGVTLQRHRDAEDGQRQAAALELAQDAPHPRAVLVDALHRQVAGRVGGGLNISEELLAAGVAVQHRVLAAFLVVQHELHGHPGVAGPAGVGWVAAVADQVAG